LGEATGGHIKGSVIEKPSKLSADRPASPPRNRRVKKTAGERKRFDQEEKFEDRRWTVSSSWYKMLSIEKLTDYPLLKILERQKESVTREGGGPRFPLCFFHYRLPCLHWVSICGKFQGHS